MPTERAPAPAPALRPPPLAQAPPAPAAPPPLPAPPIAVGTPYAEPGVVLSDEDVLRLGREQAFAAMHDFFSALADLCGETIAFGSLLGFAVSVGTMFGATFGLVFTPPDATIVSCVAAHPVSLVGQGLSLVLAVMAGSSQLRAYFGMDTRNAVSSVFTYLSFELGMLAPAALPRAVMRNKRTIAGAGCALDEALGDAGAHLPPLVRLAVVAYGVTRLVNVSLAVMSFVLRRVQMLFCVGATALTRLTTLVEFALLCAVIGAFVWRLASYMTDATVYVVAMTDEVVARSTRAVLRLLTGRELAPFTGSALGPDVRLSHFDSILAATVESKALGLVLGLIATFLFLTHFILVKLKASL